MPASTRSALPGSVACCPSEFLLHSELPVAIRCSIIQEAYHKQAQEVHRVQRLQLGGSNNLGRDSPDIDGEPTAVCSDPLNGGVLVFGYGLRHDGTGERDMPCFFRKLPAEVVWQPIENRQLDAPLADVMSQGSTLISTPDSIYLSVPAAWDSFAEPEKTLFRLSRCGTRILNSVLVTISQMCLHKNLLYTFAEGTYEPNRLEVRDRFSLDHLHSICVPVGLARARIRGIAVVERPAPVGGGLRIFLTVWDPHRVLVLKEQVPGEACVVRDVRGSSESCAGVPALTEPCCMLACGEYVFLSEYKQGGFLRILSYDGTLLRSISVGIQACGLQFCPSRRRLLIFGPVEPGKYVLDEYEVPWMKSA